MHRVMLMMSVLALGLMLCGCSTSKEVPAAGPRTPTTPDQVTIYQKAPDKRYEVLGTVTVPTSATVRWDERGEAAAGFDALKAQAAALGANGLLLTLAPEQYDLLATAGYKGTFYQVPMKRDPRRAIAAAIFILPN